MTRIPPWEAFMIPTLQVMKDGVIRHRREIGPLVASLMKITPEDQRETIASGMPLHLNRMGWGLSFLSNVGALNRPSRGNYVITDAGRKLLELFPNGATERQLRELSESSESPIRAYVPTIVREPNHKSTLAEESALTPTEQVQSGISRIDEEVAGELLQRLQEREPAFFEDAVVKLLLKMGYGGVGGSGAATRLSNDGGIDGVIDQDVLGLSRVYIQAKRYADGNSVQRPEVQAFVGALSGIADSGVFITTSRFSDGAYNYAEGVPTRVILIDGKRLAELMIRYEVGVQVAETYKVVEIDEDFFS